VVMVCRNALVSSVKLLYTYVERGQCRWATVYGNSV